MRNVFICTRRYRRTKNKVNIKLISCLAYTYQTIMGSVLDCSEQRRLKRSGGWTYHKS